MVQAEPITNRSATRFGPLLRQMRVDRSLTQEQLAERAECDKSLISHLERGTKDPTPATLTKLVRALRLTPQQETHLENAAGLAMHTATRELEPLLAAVSKDLRHDEIASFILREDLARLTIAWDEFAEAAAWLRHAQLEPARDRLADLFLRPDITQSLRVLSGSYLARCYQLMGDLPQAAQILDELNTQLSRSKALSTAQEIFQRANLFAQRGNIALREGKYGVARQAYHDAHWCYLKLEASLPDDAAWLAHVALGIASRLLAKVAVFQNQDDEALRYCDAADKHWEAASANRSSRRSAQQLEGLLHTREFRAWALTHKNDFEEAQRLRASVYSIAKKNQLTELLMKNRLYMGDDLRNRVEKAIEDRLKMPNFAHVSPRVALLAIHDEVKPWIEGAESAYREAMAECEGPGRWRDPLVWGLCLRNTATIMRFQGKFDEAEGYLSQAEQHEVDLGQWGRLPAIYQAWGDLKWDMNQLGWASKRYEQALSELDKLQEHAGHNDGSQRLQRERLHRRLDGLSRTRDQFPVVDYDVDEQPTRVWLEWRQVTRRLIQRLDRALWETGAVSIATRDMSEEWMRELSAFEALEGHRVLAQDTLSLSLVDTLPENQNTNPACARFHKSRNDMLRTQVHQWSADESGPVAHDICCRPTVEGAMSDLYQRTRAIGALDLLHESVPSGYQLEAGLFSLPLGFAVKGERILIELPPQTIRRYKMGIQDILGDYGGARQFCFRLDDHQLADELRALFDSLASLARRSTLSTVSSEQHEESTRAWLAGLLRQWDPPAVSDPINPSI